MSQESAFDARAVSPKGARGLMQLMPATAARFGVKDIFDPAQNIEAGARYLRFLLDLFDGDISLALAGYNAGEGAVKKYGYTVPPYRETVNYVRKIRRRYSSLSARSKQTIAQPETSASYMAEAE
jgi:soluble lytic murein transglycosylase-like protein